MTDYNENDFETKREIREQWAKDHRCLNCMFSLTCHIAREVASNEEILVAIGKCSVYLPIHTEDE